MLVWAASRRVPRDILRKNLRPFSSLDSQFCPSQQRGSQIHRSSTVGPSPIKHNGTHFSDSQKCTYSTATKPAKAAAEVHATGRIPDYYPLPLHGSNAWHTIKPIPVDLTNVIILDTPPSSILDRAAAKDKHETLALFSACLSTGNLVRAHLMLSQMSTMLDSDSSTLVNAHNLFLEALLKKANKSQDLKVFFVWYEDRMRAQYNISGNATTFALLLSASLKLDPVEGHVYLAKYVELWKATGHGIGDVLVLPVLTDEEVIKIATICKLRISDLSETNRDIIEECRPSTETLPEIKPVLTKGPGLAAIQHSLRSLVEPEYMPQQYSMGGIEEAAILIERQKLLEEDAFSSAQERWKKEHEMLAGRGIIANSSLNGLLWEWHQAFVPLIKAELVRVRDAEKDPKAAGAFERCLYGPFLRLLPPEKIAAIVMVELLKTHASLARYGLKTSRAVTHVGNMLEAEYLAQEIGSKKNSDLFQDIKGKNKLAGLFQKDRGAWSNIVKKAREDAAGEENVLPEWPLTVKAKLGAVLLTMLLHCAKAPTVQKDCDGTTLGIPAFCHSYQYVKGKKLGVIKLDTSLLKRLSTEPLNNGVLGRLLPMVIPPRPWTAHNEGAYYYARSEAVRTKGSREQREYVKTASKRGDLKVLFAGLDVLGRTSWRINRPVFDVVVEVWNTEEEFGDIPAVVNEVVLPPEPPASDDPKVRQKWIWEAKKAKHDARNHHSQRCSVNFKLEIAKAFLKDKFYFPHNVDFRGRAYPIPPNLNHIGDDLSRGLLMFGEGKLLGEAGLRWLKIHLANLCGVDKVSFDAREKFVDEHKEDILDSANNPLTGKRWWLEAENPWQSLAVCFALRDALKLDDPSKYVCHLPVAQDGTCNGLQHYAALGGDSIGASQVNLMPSDKPSDVYTGVAELVKIAVNEDAKHGLKIAILLKDLITRKVVKQTVMTNVYGVTFIGAKSQIASRLEEIPALAEQRFSEKSISHAHMSIYVARKVFDSIKTMFSGASEIQKWLATSAKRISISVSPTQMDWKLNEEPKEELKAAEPVAQEKKKASSPRKKAKKSKTTEDAEEVNDDQVKDEKSEKVIKAKKVVKAKPKKRDVEFMSSVVWTTPLKLPVVQPYRHDKVQTVTTNLQNVYITDPNIIDETNARKQMTAFPPNFIHSLDATHMLMSATKCSEHGLTFASVHDSFWTHPSDVDKLNEILRESFIELHSSDIMENLKLEFELRYKGYRYLQTLPKEDLLIEKIKEIRLIYARSEYGKPNLTMEEDLEWERSRDRLLNSEDESEQARGSAMVTPSVLVMKAGLVKNEIEDNPETQLGAERPEGSDNIIDMEPIDPGMDDEMGVLDPDEALFPATDTEAYEKEYGKTKEKKKRASLTTVWMPLEFPPVPKKGEFKVETIMQSSYFFS